MNIAGVDEAILSAAGERWTKVAMVIARVERSIGSDFPSSEEAHKIIFEHIEGLVRGGRLVAQGDIRLWRFSEVRRSGGCEPNTRNG
jgi:hypothetical protein